MKLCKTTGKRRHTTWNDAVQAACRATGKRHTPLRIYTCPDCGTYHLTSRPARFAVPTVPRPFTPTDLARIAARRKDTP